MSGEVFVCSAKSIRRFPPESIQLSRRDVSVLLPALPSQFIPHVRGRVCVCIYVPMCVCVCVCVWFQRLAAELHLMTAADILSRQPARSEEERKMRKESMNVQSQ